MMSMRLAHLLTTSLALTVMSSTLASRVMAEDVVELQPIPEAFDDALTEESGNFFENRGFGRQIDFMFGLGSFTRPSFLENEVIRDLNRVHNLYLYTLEQQASSGPIIRTPDLANPYNSSLYSSPAYRPTTIVPSGSEFIFERQPFE